MLARAPAFVARARAALLRAPARPLRAVARSASSSADFPGRTVRVAHVLLPSGSTTELDALEASIKAGDTSFAEAARSKSKCPSAGSGGDLGWVKRGETVPEFESVAFATPVGATARATSEFGEHLIAVMEEREGGIDVVQAGVTDLRDVLADLPPGLQLIDVREPDELERANLPGGLFTLLPLSQFNEWAPTVAATLDPEAPTYILCRSGARSQRVGTWLVGNAGFKRVFNVAGGILAYGKLIDKSVVFDDTY